MRHVWVPDARNVLLVGVLNLKMYALWGAPLTRANGYINFSKCMQAWGVLHLNPVDLFFLGNVLKPMGKPGNTWGHLEIFWSILGWRPLKTILGQWQPAGPRAIKWLKYTRSWIFWNVCIAGGTNDYLSKIYKLHFPKMMCFSATQPP